MLKTKLQKRFLASITIRSGTHNVFIFFCIFHAFTHHSLSVKKLRMRIRKMLQIIWSLKNIDYSHLQIAVIFTPLKSSFYFGEYLMTDLPDGLQPKKKGVTVSCQSLLTCKIPIIINVGVSCFFVAFGSILEHFFCFN